MMELSMFGSLQKLNFAVKNSKQQRKAKDDIEAFKSNPKSQDVVLPSVKNAIFVNSKPAEEETASAEQLEVDDKFEARDTTFYRVLTPSFYNEDHLEQLQFFQNQPGRLKSSTKREKKLQRTLHVRKLVISSPLEFRRVEDDLTIAIRQEADKIGELKKSSSMSDLLRDSVDMSDKLSKGKLEFTSVHDVRYETSHRIVGEVCHISERNVSAQEKEEETFTNFENMNDLSQSTHQEFLKTLNDTSKSQTTRPPCNKFPLHEEVEFRGNTTDIRKHRQSKTTDFDAGRRKHATPTNPKNFEVLGLVKMDTTSHRTVIFKVKEDCLLYEDETFYRVNQKARTKDKLYGNVVIKSVKYQKSKEYAVIEVKDMRNVTYVLRFQKLEFAKKFMENEKVQVYITDQKVGLMHSLRKLLGKRASQEYLEKKGIYKPEPFFGNTLKDIANSTNQLVPAFVKEAIKLLQRPENIKSLGLYRTSGNLAVIQKIRLEVDKKNLNILDEYAKDPDVLTGSLKLFFRELKEPLISHEICDRLLECINKQNPEKFTSKEHQKIRSILVKNLHEANLETFVILMRHLLEVVKFKEHNKMDAYNLAVCWGPSIVFSVSRVDSHPIIESCRDIVCLSQNATRLLDFFLIYYDLYPAELGTLGIRPRLESISEKVATGTLMRQASRDSDWSIDSSRSSQKTSGSNLSLSIDEVTKKLVDFIEPHVYYEQLYRKSGSSDKTNKIMKKLNKKKIGELDKYRNDVYELTDALRRYLKDQDCLVLDNTVESVLRIVPDNSETYLKSAIKHHVLQLLEEVPKKDTLLFILHHITKVIKGQEEQYGTVREEILNSWTNMLYKQKKNKISSENFSKFLSIAVKALNDDLPMPDVVRSSFGNSKASSMKSESMNELLKEIKNHQNEQAEKDRNSRYDNVDTDDVGEASILDEDDKTEQTKL